MRVHNARMGERQVGPLGLHLELDSDLFRSFRADGCLQRLVVPGPLGSSAWASARGAVCLSTAAPTPEVAKFVRPKVNTSDLRKLSPQEEGLLDRLYTMQVKNRGGPSKAIMGLPNKALVPLDDIDGDARFAAHVAPKFKDMWEAMMEAKDRERPDVEVKVASSYRDATSDERAWQKAVRKYLKNTEHAREATGDPFGFKALLILCRMADNGKAPSGFSGHTHGIAADLQTTENKHTWTVNSDAEHQRGWMRTWVYRWMAEHAIDYGFYRLKKETWHWEYHESPPRRGCFPGRPPMA